MADENEKIIENTGSAPAPATLGLAPSGPAVEREPENEGWPEHATEEARGAVAGNGVAVKNRRWALVVEGVVQALRHSTHLFEHPFAKHEMRAANGDTMAIDVSNTDCRVGYLADAKGNVTPAGRFLGDRLPKGQPAMHDLDVNPPLTTAEAALQFSTTGLPAPNTTAEDLSEAEAHRVSFADRDADPGLLPPKTPRPFEPPVMPGENPRASSAEAVEPTAPPAPPPPPSTVSSETRTDDEKSAEERGQS